MLFVSKNSYPRVLTQKYFISKRETLAIVSTLVKTKRHLLVRQYEHLGTSIFTDKALKYTDKDATAIRKHCYQHQHNSRLDNFQVLGNAVNNFHVQLKESLSILKMKPSLNIAKESMPLYLFDNDC